MSTKISQVNIDQDVCPKCGKDEIDFMGFEMVDNDGGFYEGTCLNCGFEGRQWVVCKFEIWQELEDTGQYKNIEPI
jgi:predicted RNA-binding Zn-ribbon protein involved in translation (DUF1610 family)